MDVSISFCLSPAIKYGKVYTKVNLSESGDTMRIEQLEILLDIAQTGSFSSTAEKRFLSQQAVGKGMRQLEQELGVKILARTNRGVQITTEGQKVVDFAKKVLSERDMLTDSLQLEQAEQRENIVLKICSNSAVTNFALPRVIKETMRQGQNFIFRISMLDSFDDMIEKLQKREFDLGLLTFNAEVLLDRFMEVETEFHMDVLARDELIGLMHKRFVKKHDGALPSDANLSTIYSFVPAYSERNNDHIAHSNDAEFHRVMLEENGAVVVMPSLAQQHFFNSKQLVVVDIGENKALLHVAIYRKDAEVYVHELAMMIRQKMQLK